MKALWGLIASAALLGGCRTSHSTAPADASALVLKQLGAGYGAVLYVSPVDCQMSTDDAQRLNALSQRRGVHLRAVFIAVEAGDTATANRAKRDLGIDVPISIGAMADVDAISPGTAARTPFVLIVKDGEIRTVIAGESMHRTIALLERAFDE